MTAAANLATDDVETVACVTSAGPNGGNGVGTSREIRPVVLYDGGRNCLSLFVAFFECRYKQNTERRTDFTLTLRQHLKGAIN